MDSQIVLTISFIVYTSAIIGVGLYSSRMRKRTEDDFTLANRELGPWVSALSASASAESGWVMLGLVGEAYLFGMSAFWIVPGIAAGYLFNWFVIAERLRRESLRMGTSTLPQYLDARFGGGSVALKSIAIVIITAAMLGYVAAQMNAAGKAFDAVFHLPYWLGVLIGAVVILVYTITGGFRAICWTDVIQSSFMFVAMVGMPIILLARIGGWDMFMQGLQSIDTHAGSSEAIMLSIAGGKTGMTAFGFVIGLLGIGLGYPGQPHILARFMAVRDEESVKRGGAIAISWMVIVYLGAVLFGLMAKVYFGIMDDPEQALPRAVSEFLPPVIGGFVIAAIVSAICSTADSQLIVVSTAISRDVPAMLGKMGRSFKQIQFTDRVVLVVLALISVFFALTENRVIFSFVLYAWSALGASFGPLVILSLLWKGTTRAGAIAGMLTGIIVTIVWRNVPSLKAVVYELVPAFVLAFLAVWLVSLMTSSGKVAERQE
ncbi:MAG: sodium/proline symporter [candidate division Zixibacteria bacterium]|nr:sodium/proline symporter [candidate division Zixibacteria bacterium]